MPKSFFAMITPLVSGGSPPRPDQGLPGEQPGIDNSLPPFPAHPIVIPPDGIAPGVPSHPIYIPPIPDNSLPPSVMPPIYIPPDGIAPGVPTHPIFLPIYPDQGLPPAGGGGQPPKPDQGLPGEQPGIDNSLPPIELPPLPEIPDDALALVMVKVPGTEAEWRIISKNSELLPPTHPTPKAGKAKR